MPTALYLKSGLSVSCFKRPWIECTRRSLSRQLEKGADGVIGRFGAGRPKSEQRYQPSAWFQCPFDFHGRRQFKDKRGRKCGHRRVKTVWREWERLGLTAGKVNGQTVVAQTAARQCVHLPAFIGAKGLTPGLMQCDLQVAGTKTQFQRAALGQKGQYGSPPGLPPAQ
jgi:hypothetical protein